MTETHHTYMDSPLGPILLARSEEGLRRINFQNGTAALKPQPQSRSSAKPFDEARRQLDSYFSGKLRDFNLELAPAGTPFQLQVWLALQEIPYGTTISYGNLACSVGNPKASRAVGAANGRNPLPIVVPCHRVIGANGNLTGYYGGVDLKRFLLQLEGVTPV